MQPGTPVIVHDPDLMDIYTAVIVEPAPEGKNPLVRIKTIVRYPIQHAVFWPDVANENAPLAEGEVCRMKVLKLQTADTRQTYAESLKYALMIARGNAKKAGRADIDRILALHERGIVAAKRCILAI